MFSNDMQAIKKTGIAGFLSASFIFWQVWIFSFLTGAITVNFSIFIDAPSTN
jgi:hypothetical protein